MTVQPSLFQSSLISTAIASTLSSYLYHNKEGALFFNDEYQRPYCWTHDNQQALLLTIFSGEPIQSISVVVDEKSQDKYMEIVDGRQRLTTLFLYVDNQFPYITKDDQEVYFKDLSKLDQGTFKKLHLPCVQLSSKDGKPVTLKQKVAYFYRTNFAGQSQSAEHKVKIEALLLAS